MSFTNQTIQKEQQKTIQKKCFFNQTIQKKQLILKGQNDQVHGDVPPGRPNHGWPLIRTAGEQSFEDEDEDVNDHNTPRYVFLLPIFIGW